ncbi:MAG TPA: MarR family winged helix-turn-helix transcriptional regulator [Burkholderiaceae bacterium]|nr:MarR family winged helix-turn-helix transcriptional regulator [Burkholderiaceae bacterium]
MDDANGLPPPDNDASKHTNTAPDASHLLSPTTRRLLDEFALDEVASHLLRRAHFVAEDIFAKEFADESLTPRQKAALIIIYQHPGANQNTLADFLFMDRNTVAEMIKRLVSCELIRREKDQFDRRAYRLYLAPAGAELLNRVMPRDAIVEQKVLERLPEEFRLLFLKCLKMIVEPD